MRYEQITAAIRQRTVWEATDLGLAMVRRWWRPIEVGFLAAALPPALIIFLALGQYPLVALAVFWWFKPFYDRMPLFSVSRLLVGQGVSFALISETPRILGGHILGDLTYRRFCPWRSYVAPVRMLEGVRGSASRNRVAAVARSGKGVAAALTVVWLMLELALVYGLFVFVMMFIRFGPVTETMAIPFTDPAQLNTALIYWLYVIVVCFMEPFYVAAGFGLYINRRVSMEGWDIELIFRRLARRIGARRAGAPVAILVMLLVLGLSGGRVCAQSNEVSALSPWAVSYEVVSEAAGQVLRDEAFGGYRERTVWRPRWQIERQERRQQPGGLDLGFLETVATWLARITPWILSGGAAFGLLYLLLVVKSRTAQKSRKPAGSRADGVADDSLEAIPLKELPKDWAEAASAAWQNGETHGALSLLYRGTLSFLAEERGLVVPDSATESECLRHVRRALVAENDSVLAGHFEDVAQAWLYLAYAGQAPAERTFMNLCARASRLAEKPHDS